jgi:N-acetylglucosamine kinase-like BadF-type ATPase
MQYPELKAWKIRNADDGKAYIRWLVANKLTFHFDDSPEDIIWSGTDKKPTPEDVAELSRIHDELWGAGDPWAWLEDQELWNLYMGGE